MAAWLLTGGMALRAQPIWQATEGRPGWSYGVEASYTADSTLKRGSKDLGDLNTTLVRASVTSVIPQTQALSWGIGPVFEYGRFDAPEAASMPSDVYMGALRLNANLRFAERWGFRMETRPGLYSDLEDVSWDDFNAPVFLAATYQVNTNLLLALGININFRSDLATIGGPGVRWRFAEDWTLNLVLPRPTLDYAISRQWSVYGGGEWRGGAYRVAKDFGTRRGEPELDDNDFSYRELRALGGVRFEPVRQFRIALEAGYAFEKKSEFRQADVTLKGDGAPFVQVLFGGRF